MRHITLQFTTDDELELCKQTDHQKVQSALAYLGTWAMDADRYADCRISLNTRDREIIATYREEWQERFPLGDPGPVTFVLAAVWHEDSSSFGFHS